MSDDRYTLLLVEDENGDMYGSAVPCAKAIHWDCAKGLGTALYEVWGDTRRRDVFTAHPNLKRECVECGEPLVKKLLDVDKLLSLCTTEEDKRFVVDMAILHGTMFPKESVVECINEAIDQRGVVGPCPVHGTEEKHDCPITEWILHFLKPLALEFGLEFGHKD